ncbi:uncharacterized protein LOC135955410 [Calliphora vicina]|uniref:uncharacterized protein LOC135955410 n=1 Tax=Calliphora vicina TaxID=7373 RepID=UPI00325A9BDC
MNLRNDNNSNDDDSNQFSKSHNMYNTKVKSELDLERNNSLDELDMSNSMYKLKLIAEIRKRRELWDIRSKEHISCVSLAEVWKDLAISMESDVGTCQRTWMSLCKVYWRSVKRIELRIKEDKLKGSYDPNNDYSSKWVHFEAMEFMKDNETVPIILGSSTETFKLIAEIRKRPAIWDIQSNEHRFSINLKNTWKELALAMGEDVENCKSKWKSLRLSYRKEAKKLELRIQEAKQNGSYIPNNDYSSEWTYFEHMQFIDDIKKPSNMKRRNSSVTDNNSDDNESNQFSKFHNMDNIKMEPESDDDLSDGSSPEIQEPAAEKSTTSNWNSTNRSYCRYSSDRLNLIAEVRKRPAIWDIQSKEHISQTILKQTWEELARAIGADVHDCRRKWKILRQSYRDEVKRLELRILKDKSNGSYDPKNEYKCNWFFYEHMKFIHDTIKPTPLKHGNSSDLSGQNSSENHEPADDKPTTSNWKCTKRPNDQVDFVEDLATDEHKLIKSSRSDITDSNDMVHVNDSDYNFLVSFLPQMKKINVLQNLQFRTKITNLMLNIMSQSKAN